MPTGTRRSRRQLAATFLAVGVVTCAAAPLLVSCASRAPTSSVQDQRSVAPPTMAATQPTDYPGLHNVVAYSDDVYSGSVPEGAAGFDTLAAFGIRTIITVDGAAPDLASAKARGLRYVHLPIGYNGMDRERTLELARAMRDLPRPIYVHCHHGKHRSAGAAGAALVTLGEMNTADAIARLKVSGTAPNYTGLYQCVNVATIASAVELASASDAFPETWKTSGTVQAMVEIDEAAEHLKAIERAGWSVPADHPDLVPAAEAGRLADLLRVLAEDEESKARPEEYAQLLRANSAEATALEEALVAGAMEPTQLSARFKKVMASCRSCHSTYRD